MEQFFVLLACQGVHAVVVTFQCGERVQFGAQCFRFFAGEIDEDFQPVHAGADEISQRVGAVVHQLAVSRNLFCRHVIAVEYDDILIRDEAVSQSFHSVGSRDGVVGQLLLHVVCFHRFSCIHCFPESPDSVAIDISPDKFEHLPDTDTS